MYDMSPFATRAVKIIATVIHKCICVNSNAFFRDRRCEKENQWADCLPVFSIILSTCQPLFALGRVAEPPMLPCLFQQVITFKCISSEDRS